jgi:hypothetical protein
MALTLQKNRYRVVLDLEVYDDFDLYGTKWRELLELEGSEDISVISVKEDEEIYGW